MIIAWTESGGHGYCDECGCKVTVRCFGPPYGTYMVCGWCSFKARMKWWAYQQERFGLE